MLRSSLKKINGEQLLAAAGIDPEARPQHLDIESFCKLASQFEATGAAAS
jgi:16S rRNA A1518/A1519 N6-dimethyltransferase RsmA/KsgA/DIM1 with predicted DNA glycosylase/AP lyase activity